MLRKKEEIGLKTKGNTKSKKKRGSSGNIFQQIHPPAVHFKTTNSI